MQGVHTLAVRGAHEQQGSEDMSLSARYRRKEGLPFRKLRPLHESEMQEAESGGCNYGRGKSAAQLQRAQHRVHL